MDQHIQALQEALVGGGTITSDRQEILEYLRANGAADVTLTALRESDLDMRAGDWLMFGGVAPGDYIVKFITPDGYSLTTANVGADATDSDAGEGGLSGCYNLESGEEELTVDAGLVELASIGDRVWEDTNGNGIQDNGEGGIEDVVVNLYVCVDDAPSGEAIATTTTDENGNYSFNNRNSFGNNTGIMPALYFYG